MEFRLDSHTHTLASGHAYCTLLEMVRAAADRGLELICITDHAPGMELTTHKDYFLNFRVLDREIYGVRVLMGAELNVMDFDGTVEFFQRPLDPNLFAKVVILKEGKLLPLEGDWSMEKIRLIRQQAKQKAFVPNAIRALTRISPTGNDRDIHFVVQVGGSAQGCAARQMATD